MTVLFLASNIRTPDRHDGSVIGFSDSNSSQKLLLHQHQYPLQRHHHHNVAQPLNEQQQQHSPTSLVSSSGEQYHQIHDNVTHQQYVVRSPNRSPSSPIIPIKPSISKHARIGDYQGTFTHLRFLNKLNILHYSDPFSIIYIRNLKS